MKRYSGNAGLALIFLALITTSAFPSVLSAQSGTTWSTPSPLVAQQLSPETYFPRIAADSAGRVHVVVNAWVGGNKPSQWASNTIFYSVLTDGGWSQPLDILAETDPGGEVWADDLKATADGRLVVALRTGARVGIAWADLPDAANARAWNRVAIDQGYSIRLGIDERSKRLYAAFDQDRNAIMLSYSDDGGSTWSVPVVIASADRPETALSHWATFVASDESVNLAWTEYSQERDWSGSAIWQARVVPGALGLATVREAARRTDSESPTIDGPMLCGGSDNSVHLFWNNGVGSTTGRFHQFSKDGGITWGETEQIYPGLSGQTSRAACVFDSVGDLHYVTAADGDGFGHGIIRHAIWRSGVWTDYTTLWPETYPGEHPALALTVGNRLHLVWDYFDRDRSARSLSIQSVYSSIETGAPSVKPAESRRPLTPSPSVDVARSPAAATPTAVQGRLPIFATTSEPRTSRPFAPTAYGAGSAVAAVAFGLLLTRRRRR